MKVVPKTMADYETFKKEAVLLKNLRHPGIPLVYDVEEDEHYSYLIEEYLEGESLYALVKRLGSLSMKATVDIGIQICRIIQFMNTAEKSILYLDLQPKNLLVCDKMVRLIDFDHAQYASEVEAVGERYGTVGFAAPEQYGGEPLDCRTDVYAIGALLYFMCRGRPPGREPDFDRDREKIDPALDRIIRGCMETEKEERYADAGEVELALAGWKEQASQKYAVESLNFIFAGAKAGCGTTHAALGFTNFLTRRGFLALYQESYDTDSVRILVRNLRVKPDEAGVYHVGCVNIRPYYGKSVNLPYHYYPIFIRDIGTNWREPAELSESDVVVLVCGGKWWETDAFLEAARSLKSYGCRTVLLWNHMSGEADWKLPPDLCDIPCLRLPFFANPLKKYKDYTALDDCFANLLSLGTGGSRAWKRKGIRNLFRKRTLI